MKAIICFSGGSVHINSFRSVWTPCECGNVRAMWIDAARGTVVVAARDRSKVRLLGLNNFYLISAIGDGRDVGLSWEEYQNLHRVAVDAPGYLFDSNKINCWAAVVQIGRSNDVRWATDEEFTDAFDLRLGPKPEELKPDPAVVGRIVSEVEKHTIPTVDRSAQVLTDGSPVPEDRSHTELRPDGQQKGYIVLTEAERAKGFVRPVRRTYIHVGKNPQMQGHVLIKPGENGCGSRTTMALSIAETYARDPYFYSGTFCAACGAHRPLEEFVWEGTTEQVGS